MDRLAIGCVLAGFGLILGLVTVLLGGLVPQEALAVPAALGAVLAAGLLVGGLLILEHRADAHARPLLGH